MSVPKCAVLCSSSCSHACFAESQSLFKVFPPLGTREAPHRWPLARMKSSGQQCQKQCHLHCERVCDLPVVWQSDTLCCVTATHLRPSAIQRYFVVPVCRRFRPSSFCVSEPSQASQLAQFTIRDQLEPFRLLLSRSCHTWLPVLDLLEVSRRFTANTASPPPLFPVMT
jgi:hypothetical protein